MKKLISAFSALMLLSFSVAMSNAFCDISTLNKMFLEGRHERAVQEAESLIGARARQRDEIYYLSLIHI